MGKTAYCGAGNAARRIENAYIGLPALRLTNLIPAISGVEGWSTGVSSTEHTKYSPQTILLNATASMSEITTNTLQKIPMIAGHKYYIRAEVFFSASTVARRNTCYWPIAEPSVWNSQQLGLSLPANQWNLLGMISDRGAAGFSSGDYEFRLDFDNDRRAGQMWIDGVMVIDLTAAFGAGSEPSQGWCNTNLPYFTGTISLDYESSQSYAAQCLKAYLGDENGVAKLVWEATNNTI